MSQDAGGPWTVARLLGWTRDYFERSGIESPRLCAEILLADTMGCDRIHLFTQHDHAPDAAILVRFRERVRDAATGRPIAYLIGRKEFFSLSFEITSDVLIPRPETETVVERAIGVLRETGLAEPVILELGAGSGCIAISLAKNVPGARIFAGDISEAALNVARRNAERHGVADRVEFLRSDLFSAWTNAKEGAAACFDMIVSNPPYLAADNPGAVAVDVRRFEPQIALFGGADGLDVIRRIVAESPVWLRPEGHLLIEVAFDQAAGVRNLFESSQWSEVYTYRDAAGHDRVVHARRAAIAESVPAA